MGRGIGICLRLVTGSQGFSGLGISGRLRWPEGRPHRGRKVPEPADETAQRGPGSRLGIHILLVLLPAKEQNSNPQQASPTARAKPGAKGAGDDGGR